MQPINKIKSRGKRNRLTTISAMTRGCLNGLRRKARPRVRTTTRHICKIARGSAKSRGLSPWKTPLDVAFIGAGHFGTVEFDAIFSQRNNDPRRNTNLQSSRFRAWIMWTSVRLRERNRSRSGGSVLHEMSCFYEDSIRRVLYPKEFQNVHNTNALVTCLRFFSWLGLLNKSRFVTNQWRTL